MFTFTNKEKEELLSQIGLLEARIKDANARIEINQEHYEQRKDEAFNQSEKAKVTFDHLNKTIGELARIKEFNHQLEAQNDVLSKIEDKQDTYKDEIHKLELERIELQTKYDGAIDNNKILLSNIAELKEERKVLIENQL